MSYPGPHNRIIANAAREVLKPRGFQQRGRSRFWFLDLGWWLIAVEFQPGGWDRGTYLNVAAMWLWYPQDYFHFDYGPGPAYSSRIGQFVTFESEEQFVEEARRVAHSAAEAADVLQREFSTMGRVATRLAGRAQSGTWNLYHAGAAAAVAGDQDTAATYFRTLASSSPPGGHSDLEWFKALRRRAGQMAEAARRGIATDAVIGDIHETRRALKLPPWDGEFTTRFRAL